MVDPDLAGRYHGRLGGRRIAWALVWRNATFQPEQRYHFFVPYPGQASVADFVRFRQDSLILFEDELPDLYQLTP